MDAKDFLISRGLLSVPDWKDWTSALIQMALGAALFWLAARSLFPNQPILTGWVGLMGLVFILHFGLFRLLAFFWQRTGINTRPIMNNPLRAESLGDFWGGRWNLAFNQLAAQFVFGPLHDRLGIMGAMTTAFLISGLVHDIVISLPARGGYGLPTLYFLLQAGGLAAERSRFDGFHRDVLDRAGDRGLLLLRTQGLAERTPVCRGALASNFSFHLLGSDISWTCDMAPFPGIKASHPVVLFDGVCNFCNFWVQFLIRRDPEKKFRFASLQSSAGAELTRSLGLDLANMNTVIFVSGEKAYFRSSAALKIAREMRGPWPLLYVLAVLPRPMRDFVYDVVARNRYRWFGKKDACMVPSPELQDRFLN